MNSTRHALAAVIVIGVMFWTISPVAQTVDLQVVENQSHNFTFTVMENSLVTYETDGNGFSAIYNSQGGGKGTHPDYALLVYGVSSHLLSTKEAKAAKLEPPEETVLMATDIGTQKEWQDIYLAQMASHGREVGGSAVVSGIDGENFEVQYFSWSQSVGLRTAYALTYVVLHNGSFIHVQVESSNPLSAIDLKWLTKNLALQAAKVE